MTLLAPTHVPGDLYSDLALHIRTDEWQAVQDGLEGKASPHAFFPPNLPPLAIKRAAAVHWATLLEALRRSSDAPYTAIGNDRVSLVPLAQLVTYAAVDRFSVGSRRAGVTLLLDGLKMGRRVEAAGNREGEAVERIVLLAVARSHDSLPLAECDRMRKFADEAIASVPSDATLMALLRLYMRVEAFRWTNLSLPNTLSAAAPESETFDPSTHRKFLLQIQGSRYRVVTEEGVGIDEQA